MDGQDILAEMVKALKGELGGGYSAIRAFVASQGKLIAKQAADIATSRATGSLKNDDELFKFFLEGLKTNAENATKAIVMLSALTLQKAWNAVAGALWDGIRSILTGAGVPDTLLPTMPPIRI